MRYYGFKFALGSEQNKGVQNQHFQKYFHFQTIKVDGKSIVSSIICCRQNKFKIYVVYISPDKYLGSLRCNIVERVDRLCVV